MASIQNINLDIITSNSAMEHKIVDQQICTIGPETDMGKIFLQAVVKP